MTASATGRGCAGPSRRVVLKGGLALAGAGFVGFTPAGARAPQRLVVTLDAAGLFGAQAVLARAEALLSREGHSERAVDLLVAPGYRPAGLRGALLSPEALASLPTDRLAALLADPLTRQITAPPAPVPLPPAAGLDRLGLLLAGLPERFQTVVVALHGTSALSEEARDRFEAALAPDTRMIAA